MGKYNTKLSGLRDRLRMRIEQSVETAVTQVLEATTQQIESEVEHGLKEVLNEVSGTFLEQAEIPAAPLVTQPTAALEVGGPSATLVPLSTMKQHIGG